MAKEQQAKTASSREGDKAPNGQGARSGGQRGRGNGSRKNNTTFKRVNLERKRPQLSRGEGADGSQQAGERRRSRRCS